MLGGRKLEHIYLCRNIILCWLISLDQVERTAGEALKLEAPKIESVRSPLYI